MGFPHSSIGKESSCNAGDPGSIPGLGRSAGEGIKLPTPVFLGFPCGLAVESTCSAGDLGSIPGLGRSPGEGKGYPLQCSGLENCMDCIVHGVAKSWTQLSDFHILNKNRREWRRQWHPTPVLLPGKSHGQKSLVGCSPWGHEESDVIVQLSLSLSDMSVTTLAFF